MTTQPELTLRNFKWSDLKAFSRLLIDVGTHGHRDWPESVEGLRADLEYPRVQPEKNLVILEISGEITGYAIVEPEQNIGRSVVGIASNAESNRGDIDGMLLDWATGRAAGLAPLAHLAIRDSESGLGEFVELRGWNRVRKYLKLKSELNPAKAEAVIPVGFTVRTMLGLDELPELTDLQNESFKAHFGYSPNTVDEIKARLMAPGARIDDVVFIHDSDERLVAYCWTQTHEHGGSLTGQIGMTGVMPDARGQGLGRAIAETGFNNLLEKGVDAIELDVDSANARAIKIYSSMGFTTSSEVDWWEMRL